MNLDELLAPSSTALLVIDMQNDFCSPGGFVDHIGGDLSAVRPAADAIRRLLDAARTAGTAVVHVRSWFDEKYLNPPMRERLERFGVEPYCVSGTWGAEFIDGVGPVDSEPVVVKHAYSGFFQTNLHDLLSARRIASVVICGTATNNCVDGTGRDAFYLGYYVALPPQASCAPSAALHEHAVATARHAYAVTPDVDEIEAVWT